VSAPGSPAPGGPAPGGPAEFPFVAVVGMEEAKLALLLASVEPRLGGVLLRGEKGSAKTTLVRGLSGLLGEATPFVELPLGATEDRVAGAIDIEAALRSGEQRFRPGLLSQAHGGVLYVDEVNLLPDHLVDLLLDAAASGRNRVEREGLSVVHECRFVLVGSMNPEEGELRPQLLDRFGLSVEVRSSRDPTCRAEAVRRRLDFDADPAAFVRRYASETAQLSERVRKARVAAVPADVVLLAAATCAELGAESLRADVVACRAAAALAGLEGRDDAGADDLRRVLPLVLAHRRRRGPFDPHGVDPAEIDEAMAHAASASDAAGSGRGAPPGLSGGGEPELTAGPGGASLGGEPPPGPAPDARGPGGAREHPAPPPPPAPAGAGSTAVLPSGSLRRDHGSLGSPGGGAPGRAPRGRVVGDEPLVTSDGPLATRPTLRRALERRALAGDAPGGAPVGASLVEASDLRAARYEARRSSLVVLCVDASASMGADQRIEAVREAAVGLLLHAYQRRDRVAVVSFSGEGATVVLRPTSSVEVARVRLAHLRPAGRTPLAAGIEAGLALCRTAGSGAHDPLLVVLTDGRATAAGDGQDPVRAALAAAARVRAEGVRAVVLDAETSVVPLGLAAALSEAMGALHVPLGRPSAAGIGAVLRELLPD